jgi:basic amino acid/polyamine antiporter, APA family
MDEHQIRQATGEKKLSQRVILFILISTILGSSLFYLPSLAMVSSGPAAIIAWAILFGAAALMMLYIGELITLHPTSGGTFEFCRRAYGRFGAFMAGWLIWIAGNFGMALGLVAAAQYFIPGNYPESLPIHMIFVFIWVIVLNYMAYRGTDAGATMLVTFGGIALAVVVLMILPSFIDIPSLFSGKLALPFDTSVLQPFFRHEGLSIFTFMGLSLLLIIEAFFGFEVVSYMANEAQQPGELHKVLVKGMLICGGIATLYFFSSLGTVSYHDYVTDVRPFAVQALNNMGEFGQTLVVFGMYLVIVGSVAGWPITGSRLIRAMAGQKLFMQHFGVLHPKHKSPYRAVYFQTIAVLLFAWILFRGYIVGWQDPYRTVYLIYVVLSLIVISMVLLCVPILRRKEAVERPYRAPGGKFMPYVFVAGFILLLLNWIFIEGGVAFTILQLAGSFIILGIPFFFIVEMYYSEKAIIKINEWLSHITVIGEKAYFPFSIRKKLLKGLENVEGKTILEYGCSFGSLTRRLGRLVGPRGRIFATDLALHKVRIADKRTKHMDHVSVHHHPYLDDFKLKLPKIDKVLSVGMLSYMQKPEVILKKLAWHVKKNGDIVFLDYDKFFYIIPNVTWIQDDQKLIRLFRRSGFNVSVTRKKGLLWTYVIITGKKV